MANITEAVVEAAMGASDTLGDRLVALVSLRKRALAERQTATNQLKTGALTDAKAEKIQDAIQAAMLLINNYRTSVEALIQ